MIAIEIPGRMALAVMIDIATHQGAGWVPTPQIATRLPMKQTYIEDTVGHLRRAGLLEVRQGYHGGYRLSRPAAEINVAQIASAIRQPRRGEDASIAGAEAWRGAKAAAQRVLERTTLTSLLGKLPEVVAPVKAASVKAPRVIPRSRPQAPNSVFDLARQPIVGKDRP